MRFLIALFAVSALGAQPTLSISGPPANQKAGTTFTLTVSVSGTGTSGDEALQFSLPLSWPVVPATGTAATSAGKAVTCAQVGPSYNCIVVGMNSNNLTDGQLATLAITIPKTAGSGTVPFSLSNLLAAATDGTGTVNGAPLVAGSPFILSITSLCDLNSDGVINAADLALIVQQAIGSSACTADLNSDGKCNIQDVQIVGNAAGSGFCAAK